ncbi:MAG: DUF1501 domain-containing protein [Pirellulales bacterium]
MSLILLWLDGGPSQLETFDPHPGKIAGPTKSIPTSVPEVRFGEGLPRLAELMDRMTIIRSVTGTELDHLRSMYQVKTGFAPSASIVHPTLGAICAAHLPEPTCELPPFITIIATTSVTSSNSGGAEAGYLGQNYNPFRTGDPINPPTNLRSTVSWKRFQRRMEGLRIVEHARAEQNAALATRLGGSEQTQQIVKMMASPQSRAFSIDTEPLSLQHAYGDNPFGRSCLAARRLVEVGVRCVEVQLSGWDSHVSNFTAHARLNSMLDSGFATLIADLEERAMLDSTLVLCMGEFGRTPAINPTNGRDHWPYGFSVALVGGQIRKGVVFGATDPEGSRAVVDAVSLPTLTATVLTAMRLNPSTESVVGARPVKLSDGEPLASVLASISKPRRGGGDP